jgi:hypothetical protein
MSFTAIKGYTAKAPLSNAATQLTALIEWVATDGGPMIPIKQKETTDLLKEVLGDISAKKCTKSLLKLGIDSGNLVVRVEGDNKYVKSTILVKGYEELKKARSKATVVNADVGDSTIDDAANKMAKVKGTTAKSDEDADLNKKGDKAPIIILAHGAPSSPIPGQVYAKEFADKKPNEIVDYLVKTKKLAKNYAGVIYLDGCYTAAGPKQGKDETELTNFAKKVYEGLVKEGYEYLQVKGNLGAAATRSDGTESVFDAQTEAELKKKIGAEWKAVDTKVKQLEQVCTRLTEKHNGNQEAIKADIGIKLVTQKLGELEAERKECYDRWNNVRKDHPELRIDNLVGIFGPEKLAEKPWYKKIFG